MKIRNGFVSNSSSSSFIVKLPRPIEEYTLEEFRELLEKEETFDPVAKLYQDLKNTSYSKKVLSDYEQKRYNRTILGFGEYIVEYGTEGAFGSEVDEQSTMEYDFMPYIENDEVKVESWSNH